MGTLGPTFNIENYAFAKLSLGACKRMLLWLTLNILTTQTPQIFKNIMLIWTAHTMTDVDLGLDDAMGLTYSESWMDEERQRLKASKVIESDDGERMPYRMSDLVPGV